MAAPGLLVAATLGLVGWKKFKETNHHDTFQSFPSIEANSPATGSFHMVRVVDGDTIVVADSKGEIHVRLIGIDAPEKKPTLRQPIHLAGSISQQNWQW